MARALQGHTLTPAEAEAMTLPLVRPSRAADPSPVTPPALIPACVTPAAVTVVKTSKRTPSVTFDPEVIDLQIRVEGPGEPPDLQRGGYVTEAGEDDQSDEGEECEDGCSANNKRKTLTLPPPANKKVRKLKKRANLNSKKRDTSVFQWVYQQVPEDNRLKNRQTDQEETAT